MFWQGLRCVIFSMFGHYFCNLLWGGWLSWWIGIGVYYFLGYLYELLMIHLYDFEMLSGQDNAWMLDSDLNTGNVTGVIFFEKFDYDIHRDHLITVTENIHRFRHKQVKIRG